MTYIEGFVAAVPKANKDAYQKHAAETAPLFKEFGATRVTENWANDVPDGEVTDYRKAVQAKDDEDVVIGWFEFPDKKTRDAANEKMMSDPRMEEMGKKMPFDGQRMIFGGFDSIVDENPGGKAGYTDGFVLPIPEGNKAAYKEQADKFAAKAKELGATRIVEGWGDDVPEGKVTDYHRAVKAEKGENIVYSFVQWPDKAARDKAWEAIMADPEMQPEEGKNPFDGKRMFWGGFEPILDES